MRRWDQSNKSLILKALSEIVRGRLHRLPTVYLPSTVPVPVPALELVTLLGMVPNSLSAELPSLPYTSTRKPTMHCHGFLAWLEYEERKNNEWMHAPSLIQREKKRK